MMLAVTTGILMSTALPSVADTSCKTVIIGIGLGCSTKEGQPSEPAIPSPNPSPTATPAPTPSASAPVPSPPLPLPQPTATVVITQAPVVVTVPQVIAPSPKSSPAAVTTPSSVPTNSPSTPLMRGEASSENGASTDPLREAGRFAPYVFFGSLTVLLFLLVSAYVLRLFPFDKRKKATQK